LVRVLLVGGAAAAFLGLGALRLFREAALLGGVCGFGGTAAFGNDFGAGDQVVEAGAGLGAVGFLRAVLASGDDEFAVLRDAVRGKLAEALADRYREYSRAQRTAERRRTRRRSSAPASSTF
jgi:hypothetical protein